MLQNHRLANVFCNAVCRLYQSALYLQNVIWFHGTWVHVISFTPIREVSLSMHQHCNTQQHDTLASFKVDKKMCKVGKKFIYAPAYICIWILVHKSAQSSIFYNNKKDHSLNTHHHHNSNLHYLRCALLWDFTQQRTVVLHLHFRTTYRCHLQGSSSTRLLDPLRWDPYVVPEHQYETTVLCCIKSQNSADLSGTVVEACNNALYYFLQSTQLYSTLTTHWQHYWAPTCMGGRGCF